MTINRLNLQIEFVLQLRAREGFGWLVQPAFEEDIGDHALADDVEGRTQSRQVDLDRRQLKLQLRQLVLLERIDRVHVKGARQTANGGFETPWRACGAAFAGRTSSDPPWPLVIAKAW